MSKPHASLSPKTNLLLIPLWAAAATGIFYFGDPRPAIVLAVVGAVLGAAGGLMQHLSLKEASRGFSAASSLLDVRRAFKSTVWGRRYLGFLYVSKGVLVGVALAAMHASIVGSLFGYLAGYFTLMFVREVVTLRDTFFLSRLSAAEVEPSEKTA